MSACCSSAGSSSAISGRFYLTVVFLVSRFFVLSDERMKWVEVPAAAVGGVCWSTWTMSGSSLVTSLQQMEYTESLSTISSERDACWRQCSSICTVSGAVPSTSGSECTVSCAPVSFVSASVPTIYTLESWQHATHSSLSGHAPPYLADDIHLVSEGHRWRLRSSTDRSCAVPRTHNTFGDRSFAIGGPRVWNSLQTHMRDKDNTYNGFRLELKTFLFNVASGAQCGFC